MTIQTIQNDPEKEPKNIYKERKNDWAENKNLRNSTSLNAQDPNFPSSNNLKLSIKHSNEQGINYSQTKNKNNLYVLITKSIVDIFLIFQIKKNISEKNLKTFSKVLLLQHLKKKSLQEFI